MNLQHKIWIAAAMVTILLASCEKDNQESPVEKEVISDNVILMDEYNATLLSDSVQQSEGLYALQFESNPPEISVGDVIVSTSDGGYLREVTSYEKSDNSVSLQTRQATLEDLFEESEVAISFPLKTDAKSAKLQASVNETMVDGIEVDEDFDGIKLGLKDVVIKAEDGDGSISYTLNSGEIKIVPNLVYNHKIDGWTLEKLKLTSYNTAIDFEANISINGVSAAKAIHKGEKPIYTKKTWHELGPLAFEVDHEVYIKLEGSANIAINYNYHLISNYLYDMAATYENDEFEYVFERSSESHSVINDTYQLSAGGELKGSIVYKPSIKLFTFVGPYLEANAYATIDGAYSTKHDWNLNLGAGISSKAGIVFTVLSKDLFDVSKKITSENWDIYATPYKIEKVEEETETGSIYDPVPVKVKISDNLGYAVEGVKVYFVPETLSGVADNDFVKTNSEGIAETIWTPEPDEEARNKLAVYARKGDGTYINEAPLEYTVSNTFTDARDGNEYKAVKIGNQLWMAENLAYLPAVSSPSIIPTDTSIHEAHYSVYGYEGSSVDVARSTGAYETYGVLYNLTAALSACPDGWHLPTPGDWEQLATHIASEKGGEKSTLFPEDDWVPKSYVWSNIGGYLKAKNAWNAELNAVDSYNFAVHPAGYRVDFEFTSKGSHAMFWQARSANEPGVDHPIYGFWRFFNTQEVDVNWDDVVDFSGDDILLDKGASRGYSASIRCVKD